MKRLQDISIKKIALPIVMGGALLGTSISVWNIRSSLFDIYNNTQEMKFLEYCNGVADDSNCNELRKRMKLEFESFLAKPK